MTDLALRLREVIEPYLGAEHIELDDVEVVGSPSGGRIVRVLVDGENAVGIDRIADLSRGIGRLLDDEEDLGTSWTLEVGSPGLERKLRLPTHFAKSVGREVKIKTRSAIDESKSHKGLLTASDETSCTVDVAGTERTIPFEKISSARTVFTWERGAKPGKKESKGPQDE